MKTLSNQLRFISSAFIIAGVLGINSCSSPNPTGHGSGIVTSSDGYAEIEVDAIKKAISNSSDGTVTVCFYLYQISGSTEKKIGYYINGTEAKPDGGNNYDRYKYCLEITRASLDGITLLSAIYDENTGAISAYLLEPLAVEPIKNDTIICKCPPDCCYNNVRAQVEVNKCEFDLVDCPSEGKGK